MGGRVSFSGMKGNSVVDIDHSATVRMTRRHPLSQMGKKRGYQGAPRLFKALQSSQNL